jgi:cation diffusion facilitator family transporter
VAIASVIGFAGNEIVAGFRIRVGKQINSAALVADGYHARVDGLTSLGVLLSAVGVWLGYPLADPIMGLLITVAIMPIVWESAKAVLGRLLDGVDPEVIDEITHAINHTQGVRDVTEVRLRWSGHRYTFQWSSNFTGSKTQTAMGCLPIRAGSKSHFLTASAAAMSRSG